MPMSERKRSSPGNNGDLFHVIHKVPAGDSPYVRAKHVQVKDSWCFRMVWTNGFYLDFVVFDLNTHSC
jgi:hypothetical protein